MKKTFTLSLSAVALMASGIVPAQAAEAQEAPAQVAISEEARLKMNAEAARHWYGQPVGEVIVLDSKATAQQYQRGYVVNYAVQADGTTYEYQTALSNEVYAFWTGANGGATFEQQVVRYGYPMNTEIAQHNWRYMSKGALTRFYREGADDRYGTILAYHPGAGKVMDRSWWQYADDAIDWNESVVLGDSNLIPSRNSGYVAKGLQAAGYSANEYTAAGAGISAVGAGGQSIKNMVVDNGVALGIGTPWVVNIQASAADADVDPAVLEVDLRATIAELKKVYPHARVLVNDVPSASDDQRLNALSERLEAVSVDAGARFVATRGWVTQHGIEAEVDPVTGYISEAGQTKIATSMKWALHFAINKK
ncbi:SGNH/GDSL hydrolase family protein [Rothia sp. ZJ1223]|uniref:SGNH/GDSL hydrolase family protein n=1 Tax=Rothia sp. ZJ1223 TaxID=2811098 RepID=UPI0019561B07|nr:SGNH/GDSL hydrolase family protein [Rothia sp. ZJ1223]MBM7052040.1 SGNH/GDSL hydrolase family protein [Rothia sp. ZJ1223]